jgi:hypothetical protein
VLIHRLGIGGTAFIALVLFVGYELANRAKIAKA